MDPIIKTINLKKTYVQGASRTEAVKGASLEIYPGETIAVTGPSGCGKTTLLNMIGLIARPTEGKLMIGNEDATVFSDKKCAKYRNRFFGYVVQEFALLEEESVYNNIEIPLLYASNRPNRSNRKKLIRDLLAQLGLEGKAFQKAKNLSGGQRQRVDIARAIINNPQIILADEPTGALDSKNSEEVFSILNSLTKKGKTLILITHNQDLAKRCNRQIEMIDGQIVG